MKQNNNKQFNFRKYKKLQELLPYGQSKISSDSYTKVWSGVTGVQTIVSTILNMTFKAIICNF